MHLAGASWQLALQTNGTNGSPCRNALCQQQASSSSSSSSNKCSPQETTGRAQIVSFGLFGC
jgi:hypothetical protein